MSKLPIPFAKHTTYKGHGGIDFPQARGTTFRASGPGVVYHRNSTPRGGDQIWVRYDTGVKVGYCHMDSFDGAAAIGTRVVEGSPLGRVGSKGKKSTGPHLHIEISGQAYSAAVWKYFDPARVVGNSGGGSSSTAPAAPAPPTNITQEDDMPIMLKANVNIYVLSPGQIKLCDSTDQVTQGKREGIPQIDLTGTTAQQNEAFADRLDFYGIPRSVVAHGEGWVLNPETGKHEENGMWSWERVNKALLTQLLTKK